MGHVHNAVLKSGTDSCQLHGMKKRGHCPSVLFAWRAHFFGVLNAATQFDWNGHLDIEYW